MRMCQQLHDVSVNTCHIYEIYGSDIIIGFNWS